MTAGAAGRRVGVYARVSTGEQSPENQLLALRSFATARGWSVTEFVDQGVSGVRESRPALDALMAAVRSRKVDIVSVVKLDRLARSLRHLVSLAGELEALGVDLVVLDQQLDTTTPAGRLMFHVLGAIAEFERSLIVDRVKAGLRRARGQGTRLGRPRVVVDVLRAKALLAEGRSLRATAGTLGVAVATLARAVQKTSERGPLASARQVAGAGGVR